MELPRDTFINKIYEATSKNRDIYFLNADLGAKALDRYREDFPEQFIHMGISEQNMIDVAAGLALNGKSVFCYAMAPFVSLRCFEQIKVALASMNLPATIVGVGAGYSYAPAGPTHYATEDLSVMCGLAGIEVYTPSDALSVSALAKRCLEKPALRYVRIDREHLPEIHKTDEVIKDGLAEVVSGEGLALVASGYMVHRALEAANELKSEGKSVGVIDVARIKPFNAEKLKQLTAGKYQKLICVDEHFYSGGLGSVICEAVCDLDIPVKVKRMSIQEGYHLENGNRKELHEMTGIDVPRIVDAGRQLLG